MTYIATFFNCYGERVRKEYASSFLALSEHRNEKNFKLRNPKGELVNLPTVDNADLWSKHSRNVVRYSFIRASLAIAAPEFAFWTVKDRICQLIESYEDHPYVIVTREYPLAEILDDWVVPLDADLEALLRVCGAKFGVM